MRGRRDLGTNLGVLDGTAAARLVTVLAAALTMTVLLGSCTSGDEVESLPTTTLGSLDEVDGAGYELIVEDRGAMPWWPLLQPAPVGPIGRFDVRREEDDVVVFGAVDATVERSAADGSAQQLSLDLDVVDASDITTAIALRESIGASMWLARDAALATIDWNYTPLPTADGASQRLARQLLDSLYVFSGPLPVDELGVGAWWRVEVRTVDGVREAFRFDLRRFDGERYVIEVTASTGTVVLEGRVGEALPDRQELTLGDVTTTVIIRSP